MISDGEANNLINLFVIKCLRSIQHTSLWHMKILYQLQESLDDLKFHAIQLSVVQEYFGIGGMLTTPS